jgi:hypothetical protein
MSLEEARGAAWRLRENGAPEATLLTISDRPCADTNASAWTSSAPATMEFLRPVQGCS